MTFFENYRQLALEDLNDEDSPLSHIWAESHGLSSATEEWDLVRKARPRSTLFPDSLRAKSALRPSGYALWDWIVCGGRPKTRRGAYDRIQAELRADDFTAIRSTNRYWVEHMWPRYAARQLGDGSPILDLSSLPRTEAEGILKMAHHMAHVRGDAKARKAGGWSSFMATSRSFAQAIAELAVSRELNLPVNPELKNSLPWGVVAVPSPRAGFTERPAVLQVPFSHRSNPSDDLLYVCVGVEAGVDPLQVTDITDRTSPVDWWSYQPLRLHICGWETAAWVFSQETARLMKFGWESTDKQAVTTLCADLLPVTGLAQMLLPRPATPQGYKPLGEWLEEDWERPGTPSLPCPACLLRPLYSSPSFSLPGWRGMFDPDLAEKDQRLVRKEFNKTLRSALRSVHVQKGAQSVEGEKEYTRKYRVHRDLWEAKLKTIKEKDRKRRRG
jgi:hypothetical protein